MNQKKGRGNRESSWLAARRCLAMLLRLQQGPATKQQLLDVVHKDAGGESDGRQSTKAINRRFEEDKRRLADQLGVKIRYSGDVNGYVIEWWERPLLNLPNDDIQTLAFLNDTFQPDSPHAAQVQQLVDRLASWLPLDRQYFYQKASGKLPDVDLRLRDSDKIALDVWETVLEAHNHKQQLSFDYLSSSHADGIPRQHIVEPWHFYFSDRGHYRLRAYCLFNDGPNGPWNPKTYINYRISRIVPDSAKVLPTKLPPQPRTARPYTVAYELAPEIARFGVSRRPEMIGEPEIKESDDGWVRVEGKTHDVFELARNLLYYGANCRVLGGAELLGEMKKLVTGLAGIYS